MNYAPQLVPRLCPPTMAGCASMRIQAQRVHVVPGFFHPWMVPFWTTESPGVFKWVSVPSSMISTSSPWTGWIGDSRVSGGIREEAKGYALRIL